MGHRGNLAAVRWSDQWAETTVPRPPPPVPSGLRPARSRVTTADHRRSAGPRLRADRTRDAERTDPRPTLERISTGDLEPGAQMPSERSLSEQFHVARTSVREAIQGLVSLGVIERRGNRTYVADRLPDVRSPAATTARRSCVSSSRPDERSSSRSSNWRPSAPPQPTAPRSRPWPTSSTTGMELDEFRRLDRDFHVADRPGVGQPTAGRDVRQGAGPAVRVRGVRRVALRRRNRGEVERIVDESADHHATIAAAIAAGDVGAAVREGGRHLDSVEQRMLDRLV